MISAVTLSLLGGFFACQALGTTPLKGLAQPLEVYQVLYESTARSRLEVTSGLVSLLVGREQEVALLRSAGRRSRMARGRWCYSVVRRALANRAWCRC